MSTDIVKNAYAFLIEFLHLMAGVIEGNKRIPIHSGMIVE
jgi:hypothetical protein